MAALLVAMHLGKMHPYEHVLTLVLAFGPFVVLALVIALRRHDDDGVEPADVEPADVDAQRER